MTSQIKSLNGLKNKVINVNFNVFSIDYQEDFYVLTGLNFLFAYLL